MTVNVGTQGQRHKSQCASECVTSKTYSTKPLLDTCLSCLEVVLGHGCMTLCSMNGDGKVLMGAQLCKGLGIGWIVILERRLFLPVRNGPVMDFVHGPIVIASLNWRGEGIQGSARECSIGSIEMEGSYAFSLEWWGPKGLLHSHVAPES